MIKAVIFDLDNTLYNEDDYFFEVFKTFCDKYELNLDEMVENFTDEFKLKSKDYFEDILKKLDFYSSARQNELFEIYKNINCSLHLRKDAYEILDFLQKKDIKIALITNGDLQAQQNKVKTLNLQNFIVIYAREFGKDCEKPHPISFLKTLKVLNLGPNEAIFVGDNPLTDIKGARNAKIKAYRLLSGYTAKIECKDCKNIQNLLELQKLIG